MFAAMALHPDASEAQARYSLLRALIDLRVAELVAALGRHEADRANWEHADLLLDVQADLGKAVERLGDAER